MIETANKIKKAQKSSSNKKLSSLCRSVMQVLLGFACVFGILCVALVCLKILIKGENRKAVNEYNKDNYLDFIKLNEHAVHIKGSENGEDFDYIEDGKLCKGIKIGGIDISEKDYNEARKSLLASMDEILSEINITVSAENARFIFTAADLGVTSNINEILHDALKIGRKSADDYLQNYLERQQVAEDGINFEPEFYMNDKTVSNLVDKIAEFVNTEPVEPYITLTDRLTGANSTPDASTSDIYDKITVYTPFDTAVADIVFHKGGSGLELDREDLIAKFKEAFDNKNYGADIEIACKEKGKPRTNVEDLFASMKKITSFSTEYKSSGKNRSFNLSFGASKLNCMVMEPGVEISFNLFLGERREIDGWKLAHQIVNGNEYVDTPGGGLCQISTTLYNALMQAGAKLGSALDSDYESHEPNPLIEITDRSHHSIPSDYVDLGLDATVSYPSPDLKWKCIGNSPLFLFAYTDNKNKILYMDIYGSFPDDGYTYKIYSKLISTTMPKEPIEIPEPLWPEGFDNMTIKPRKGYTADVYRQKYDHNGNKAGNPVFLYRDVYSSVRGEHHYGTGSPDLPKP